MTPSQFRRAALALPEATEGAHMGHADFRVGGKVFATLGYPDRAIGMVQLTPEQQAMLVETAPAFTPVPGGWGRRGCTYVRLAAVDPATLKSALATAWRNRAPKALLERIASGAGPTLSASRAKPAAADRASRRVRAAIKASKLPDIEEGTFHGLPALKVRGKFLMRVKDADTLVLSCALEEKAFLMEAAPEIYFDTDHYSGWPAVLARMSAISDAELIHRIAQAWRLQAPKRLVARLVAEPAKAQPAAATRKARRS